MASLDIGLDLGTNTIVAGSVREGILFREPAIIAVDSNTNRILSIGGDIKKMVGREPESLKLIYPLRSGVISNYPMTRALIAHYLKLVGQNHMLKPRVIICVPSGITQVEAMSVVDATMEAGAREVHLIEEPVAAALGAGLDISRPSGKMVVDIGGGTSDAAILSMDGVVSRSSVRVAGNAFDEAIQRYMRNQHNIVIGANTAEQIKMHIGSVWQDSTNLSGVVKGRNVVTGIPDQVPISRKDLYPVLRPVAEAIGGCVQQTFEITPPELVGDIQTNGLLVTGGGGLIHGLDFLFGRILRVPTNLAENPMDCAALGTIRAFDYIGLDFDGFFEPYNIFS